MIINFSVQNFGCIKDKVTLSFEASSSDELEDYYIVEPKPGLRLLKLGLIYGANASGKTTVLKALGFLRDMVLESLDDKTEIFDFKPYLFDEKTPNENTFITLEFIQNQVKYLYEVEFNKQAVINERLYFYQPNKALVYNRETNVKKQLSEIEFGSKVKINKNHKVVLEANTLWNNTVLGGYLKTNVESDILREVIDWFDSKLDILLEPTNDINHWTTNRIIDKPISKKNILQFLKKADFNIKNVSIKTVEGWFGDHHEVVFYHEITAKKEAGYALSYEEESQGTQRYYQFSGLLDEMISEEKIQPIDELASSLHPDLLKHFLLTFLVNSKKSQLIATTHYRELLMEKDIFRNDVIWFTEKKEDGGTDLFSLADFDSSVIRNTSSIYNAYKVGKLGAVPNLKDYYIELEDAET